MASKNLFRLVILLIFFFLPRTSILYAQIDPYSRLSDPRSITLLNDSLSNPIQGSTGSDVPQLKDNSDGFAILAAASGQGILTHSAIVYNTADTATRLKIWIDDSLVAFGTIYDLINTPKGQFRLPFSHFYFTRGVSYWINYSQRQRQFSVEHRNAEYSC